MTFTADQALHALARDDYSIAGCVEHDPRGMRASVSLRPLFKDPELVMVTVYNSCACGENNCPFWVYRVEGASAKKVLDGLGYSVKVVRPEHGDGPPDIVSISHDSAAISFEDRYRYEDGAYVAAQTWRLRGDERKPMTMPVRFAAGTSSARLQGKVGLQWGDEYDFAASAGQVVSVANVQSQRAIVIRLQGGGLDRTLSAGQSARLPAAGTYKLTVDITNSDDAETDSAYALTLAIH